MTPRPGLVRAANERQALKRLPGLLLRLLVAVIGWIVISPLILLMAIDQLMNPTIPPKSKGL